MNQDKENLIKYHKDMIELCKKRLLTASNKVSYSNRIRAHQEELNKLEPRLMNWL